jgi:hypothetical protein
MRFCPHPGLTPSALLDSAPIWLPARSTLIKFSEPRVRPATENSVAVSQSVADPFPKVKFSYEKPYRNHVHSEKDSFSQSYICAMWEYAVA